MESYLLLSQMNNLYCFVDADDFSFWQELNDNKDIRNPTVFFKVVKILPKSHGHKGTYLADIHHSTLYQVCFNPYNAYR